MHLSVFPDTRKLPLLWEEVDRSIRNQINMWGSSFVSKSKNIFLKVVHMFRILNTGSRWGIR